MLQITSGFVLAKKKIGGVRCTLSFYFLTTEITSLSHLPARVEPQQQTRKCPAVLPRHMEERTLITFILITFIYEPIRESQLTEIVIDPKNGLCSSLVRKTPSVHTTLTTKVVFRKFFSNLRKVFTVCNEYSFRLAALGIPSW